MQNSIVRPLGRDMQNVLIGFVGEHEARTFFVRTRDDLTGYTVGLVIDDVDCGAMTKAPMPDGSIMLSLTLTSDMLGKGGDKVCQLLMTKDAIVRKSSQFRAYVGASNDINSTAPDSTTIIIISEKITELVHEAALDAIAEVQEVIDSIPADYSALSDQVDTNTEDISGLKADLDAQSDSVNGEKTVETPTVVSGVNFKEGATKYISAGSYTTLYIPVTQFDDYIISVDNSANGNSFEARFAFSTEIPANNIEGTYVDKVNVNARKSVTFEYHADASGYLGIAYWTNNLVTFTIESLTGGIKQRISAVEGVSDEIVVVNGRVDDVEAEIIGTPSDIVFTEVTGINFVANATAYTLSSNHTTWYLPVVAGGKYVVDLVKRNVNDVECRLAYSTEIPTANVSGAYIGAVTVEEYKSARFEYSASKDGYLGVAIYVKGPIVDISGTAYLGGIEQRIAAVEALSDAVEAVNTRMDGVGSTIDLFNGDSVELEARTFYGGAQVGSTLESALQISVTSQTAKGVYIELPAGQTVRLIGAGVSSLTRLFFAFDASTGVLIDVSNTKRQEVAGLYYLKYEVDTHVYINCVLALPHEITVIEDMTKPFGDEVASPYKMGDIMALNGAEYIRHAVKSMKRPVNGKTVPAVFLHFSDIHGDVTNLKRILDFANEPDVKNTLSDIICTGDMVPISLTDGMTWYSGVSGSENILMVAGNHDSIYGSGNNTSTASKQDVYNALISTRVSGWNVTQPTDAETEYLGYYYKDYATNKLRIIFLDTNSHNDADYLSAENTWLASVLASAKTAGLSVVCANHFIFANSNCSVIDCSFSPRIPQKSEGSWIIPSSFISTVEDFISNDGDFICWLGGHGHQDHVLLHSNGHQLCIGVSLATYNTERAKYGDDSRMFGTKSQDLFNIIAFDTYSKHISILRVGCDLTRLMNSKRHLCIDYANRQVIWND